MDSRLDKASDQEVLRCHRVFRRPRRDSLWIRVTNTEPRICAAIPKVEAHQN